MKFIHRLGFYLGGFAIGLVILFFFLGGKRASCDYFPDARVLKNIRNKDRIYTQEALNTLNINQIDTSIVSKILKTGDVDFSKSEKDKEPCPVYLITGRTELHNLELWFENCDSTATLTEVLVLK